MDKHLTRNMKVWRKYGTSILKPFAGEDGQKRVVNPVQPLPWSGMSIEAFPERSE
jgi:hypothetical protein